jgi:D-alanyl-D-alanine dipeptidase
MTGYSNIFRECIIENNPPGPGRILSRYSMWLIAFAILTSLGCRQTKDACGPHPNPWNLDIVYCMEDYQRMVKENPVHELCNLDRVIPGLILDIRYASTDNFTGTAVYPAPLAFAREPVAKALKKAQDSLSAFGLGLKVYDAYRPYAATVKFYELIRDTNYVAHPSKGSRHNRGCAVDVSLVSLETGREIPMPSAFDDFSEKAHPAYPDLPLEVIRNRSLLFGVMQHFGFDHYPTEWWHFDFRGWADFPLMDIPFEELTSNQDH